jgi:hypothetical protein
MFLVSTVAIGMIALTVIMAASLVTHDLTRLIELTAAGTALSFLCVVVSWRRAMKHSMAGQEAVTPWLHVPSSIAHGVDAWQVLRGEAKLGGQPPAAAQEATATPADAGLSRSPQ